MSYSNKIPNRNKQVTSPSAKDTSPEPQINKFSHADPLHQLDILNILRQEVIQVRSELVNKDAQIARYKSEMQGFQSNKSYKEMIDNLNSSRQQLEKDKKQALNDLQRKWKLEFQKFKSQCLSKKTDQFTFPNDSFIQKLPSSSAEIEVKTLKDQIKLLTETNKGVIKQLAESKSGSEAVRVLESELADMRSKLNGYERQIAEKDGQNRSLQDEISSFRRKAANVDGETTAKKEVIKKLCAFIKRSWMTLESDALKDQKIANPAKSINEGAQIEEAKLKELERYQVSFLKSINEKISNLAKSETINIKEISRLHDQIDQVNGLRSKKQAQLKQEQDKTLNLANQATKLQKRLQQEVTERSKAQATNARQATTISEQKNTITTCQKKIGSQLIIITQLEQQKKQNLATIKTQADRIVALEKLVKSLQADLRQTKMELAQKTSQLERAKAAIITLQGEKKILNDNLNKAKNDLSTANEAIKTKNSRISTLEALQRKLKDDIKRLQEDVNRLQGDIEDLKAKLTNAKSDIFSLNNNLTKEKEDHKKSLGVINNVNKMMIAQASQLFTRRTKLLEKTSPDKSAELEGQINGVLGQWRTNFNAAKFFNGSEVIARESIDWMLETLRYYMKDVPASTRLVYRFDPLNEKTNFHKYFDGVPNLLVLVHLSNGTKIGGFTAYPVIENNIQKPGKGFIFSLTDSKAYYMRHQPRIPVASYDTYYFILGNAELRLRSQEKKVFSNFGIANSTFDNDSDLRTKFLRISEMTNNEQPIETYEFYEVRFE